MGNVPLTCAKPKKTRPTTRTKRISKAAACARLGRIHKAAQRGAAVRLIETHLIISF